MSTAITEIIRKGLSVFRITQSETDMPQPNTKGAGPKKRQSPPQSPTKRGGASQSNKNDESVNLHVPKTQSSWELIRRGLSIWKSVQSKTDVTEPKAKPKRKGTFIPKYKQSSSEESKPAKSDHSLLGSAPTGSAGYSFTNEKIHCILQDTRNFNGRIKSFSGTSKEDKEYLDIEDVLFYNLTELVHINTDNIKLKKQKLDAIFQVQEIIKKLDLRLEENVERAIKRIGYNSDILVVEGKNKPKPIQRSGYATYSDSAKNKRNRPQVQITIPLPHSLPLVDEINKVKTSLKSVAENRPPSRKGQIIQNGEQMKGPEEKETPEASSKFVEQKDSIHLRDSEQATLIPLNNDAPKTGDLKPLQKNKPDRETENSSEKTETVEENTSEGVEQKQPEEVAATSNTIQSPMESEDIKIQPEQTESCLGLPIQTPEKNEKNNISTTSNGLCANLDQNRGFSLVRALVNAFSIRRNTLRLINPFKMIQRCVQEAQNTFDFFRRHPYGNKSNYKQHQNLVKDHKQSKISTLGAIPLRQKGIKNSGDGETGSIRGGMNEQLREDEANVMQTAESRKISGLLLQIRFLLFLTMMKLLQIPYEIAAALSIVLWLWER